MVRMKSTSSEERSNGADDRPTRLCDLPNEVLHRIMVLLPIEEAVRTCVLTRMHEHVWRSMPRLIFIKRDCKVLRSHHFISFVHKVCTLHDPLYPIQKFELRCDLDIHDAPLVHGSIEVAIKSRVQELSLDLSTYYGEPYVLPHCTLSSKTLVQLQLSGNWGMLKLPDCVSLQRLKVLTLRKLKVLGLKSIQKLFSPPLLEELNIDRCIWVDIRSVVTVSAPNLRRLHITSDGYYLPPLLWMHCDSLKELEFYGELNHEFHVYGQSMNLNKALLSLGEWTVSYHAIKLLNFLSSTKRLTLYHSTSKFNRADLDSSRQRLSSFDNLIELSFSGFYTLGVEMLRKSPSLQFLTIQRDWHTTRLQTSALLEDTVSLCHLKKIIITPRDGKIDVDFIGMLLKTSVVLEEVVLEISRSGADAKLLEMVKNLAKVSEDCKISPLYY